MKFFFSFILAFLITLPNCGMVFAEYMNIPMSHSMVSHMSESDYVSREENNNQSSSLNCCLNNPNNLLERDVNIYYSLKIIPLHPSHGTYFLEYLPKISMKIVEYPLYRSNAPPDPGEYVSLIGSSVKKLN